MRSCAPLRVAIVDDDALLRDSLGVLIGGYPGYACVGAWRSVEQAMVGLDEADPDLLLLDVDLPGTRGPEGVELLLARRPRLGIVMFSVHDEQEEVFRALCNGACGYLLKDTPPDRLIAALGEAADGGAPLSSGIARQVLALFRRIAPRPRAGSGLTAQELKLLGLLAEGHSYVAAAGLLCVSVNTIRSHVRNIYEKLHVHSRSQAVHEARLKGIL